MKLLLQYFLLPDPHDTDDVFKVMGSKVKDTDNIFGEWLTLLFGLSFAETKLQSRQRSLRPNEKIDFTFR